MHETVADLRKLQALLDRSYASAGEHLLSIHSPERRMTAERITQQLTGVCILALATVTADGRPRVGPVDGLFYRGEFWFGSSSESVRFRHLRRNPAVSAVHTRGEDLAVTVHGRAAETTLRADAGFAAYCAEVYHPRYGESWSDWAAAFPHARIEAERMYAFEMTGP
jgi:hypothetical protein